MVSPKDKGIIRQLAARYSELASSPEMARRREVWRKSNMLEERTVPFVIEDNGSFTNDLIDPLQTEGVDMQRFERYFKTGILFMEDVPDDKPFPDFFPVGWRIDRPSICPELERQHAADVNGNELGFETNKPLADLEPGLDKLQRGEFKVDREETQLQLELAEDIFGDLLPSRLINDMTLWASAGLTGKAVLMMGMAEFYMAMMDQPENVHRLFDFLSTEAKDFQAWLIAEDLIMPNSWENRSGSGTFAYSDELPKPAEGNPRTSLEQCWGFAESQESVGISNEMYAEFIHPHQRKLAKPYALIKYGCCEPVDPVWETISQFENLRKVTVSPWCNQEYVAEKAGKNIIMCRKPEPLKLCGEVFNPDEYRAHIKETLDITKDNFVELVHRDTCTMDGTMKGRIQEACGIVKELIGR